MTPEERQDAACRTSTVNFFPEPVDHAGIAAAVAVCGSCPVLSSCATQGEKETAGVWGGIYRGRKVHRPRRYCAWCGSVHRTPWVYCSPACRSRANAENALNRYRTRHQVDA